MVRVDAVSEQALAAAQDDRVDQQPIFVHQVVAQELVDQVRTAEHHQSPPGCAFSFATWAATSPEMIVVLFQSARFNVLDTTYSG